MSLSQIFDIAGSGMAAQSIRLNTTASNIANADSAASSIDEVYRARKPIFSAVQEDAMRQAVGGDFLQQTPESVGVEVKGIVESDAPLDMRYQPDHPLADEQGYVMYPNVNVVEEMADMLSASRSFQTNIDVMDAAKTMMQRLLTLGQ
ncbi:MULTISPECIES: flagellar basal body rod protein FlgC [unclassified Oleiphilus]|jgi:flagellar basal-body rod protein FlgC|uniref:flagellar basal body rod protein FlgC n=2 Tax=Oleiphilus TaxID=141450 RepID=UPI0007C33EE1|nr:MULTISPECIES: flagellar basal body rod protein FlgC [unclassified Oleiphilus]KZY77763.1 flagellar basal-body rod protein FlgC [Oleiphilus sp. HI0069]KZY81657.1 flagellar basal-body rod protein FlgC [Oleiphilus sp. HI0068]KZY96849.1 flagellar basal-body rod protein FlgC [Oleiphilus sp. HI0072]KZZ12481.1 flagellar basal-body rod protein FlgC [Oleiphilus sp. HI0078]KZZ20431.1 flagellar basal-body rod protein FlgC [Oleiphilus sp. HI0081]